MKEYFLVRAVYDNLGKDAQIEFMNKLMIKEQGEGYLYRGGPEAIFKIMKKFPNPDSDYIPIGFDDDGGYIIVNKKSKLLKNFVLKIILLYKKVLKIKGFK